MSENITFTREMDVRKKVEDYLESKGWRIKGRIKIRGRYPDIIGIKNNKILVVEVKGKLGNVTRGIGQIIHYSSGSNYAYLALPKTMITKDIVMALKGVKIGLFSVDDEMREIIKPLERKPLKSVMKRILKQRYPRPKREKFRKISIPKLLRYPAIIKEFLKYPDKNFNPSEISKKTNISYPTVWRYVQELERSGIIFIEKIGEYNICKLNKYSDLVKQLEKFLKLELSPHRLAAKEFIKKVKKMREVRKVVLFGSVARREEKLESDIDIAIFTEKKTKNLEKNILSVVDEILKNSKMKIIPILLTKNELRENEQFTNELKKGVVLYERNKRS